MAMATEERTMAEATRREASRPAWSAQSLLHAIAIARAELAKEDGVSTREEHWRIVASIAHVGLKQLG
jgi:hypothetical protein